MSDMPLAVWLGVIVSLVLFGLCSAVGCLLHAVSKKYPQPRDDEEER